MKPDPIAITRIWGFFVAYYVNDLGALDFDRIAFGHGITREAAISDLKERTKNK